MRLFIVSEPTLLMLPDTPEAVVYVGGEFDSFADLRES